MDLITYSRSDQYDLCLVIMFVVFYTQLWRAYAHMPDDQRGVYSLVIGLYCAQFYTRLFLL